MNKQTYKFEQISIDEIKEYANKDGIVIYYKHKHDEGANRNFVSINDINSCDIYDELECDELIELLDIEWYICREDTGLKNENK